MPWARPTRATTRRTRPPEQWWDTTAPCAPFGERTAGRRSGAERRFSAAPVDVDDVDPDGLSVGECLDDGAQRCRGATGTADDATEVLGVHAHLEQGAPAQRLAADLDVVRVRDDAADEVLQGVDQHGQPSACAVSPAPSTWAEVSLPPGAPSSAASAGWSLDGCSLDGCSLDGWSLDGCSLDGCSDAWGATGCSDAWGATGCSG